MPPNAFPDAEERWREIYDRAEQNVAGAVEGAITKPSVGRLLVNGAENIAALTRLGNDLADLVLRNLRVAGRADIFRLARQLQRTEDKLERLLQEIEQLRDDAPPRPSS